MTRSTLTLIAFLAAVPTAAAQELATSSERGILLGQEGDPCEPCAPAPSPAYRRLRGMWIPGISVFGSVYGVTLVGTIAAAQDYEWSLAVPVLGPFITGAIARNRAEITSESFRLYVTLGFVQAAALTLFAIGFYRRRVPARQLAVVPNIARDRLGLEVVLF